MPNNWIEWNGGEQPVPDGTLVDVEFRCGDEWADTILAEELAWGQPNEPRYDPEGEYDIVRYRIHD